MKLNKIEAVVLDLGNVVLDLSPHLTLEALGKKELPFRFSKWPVYMAYECGKMDTNEFIRELQKSFQVDWHFEEVTRVWNLMLPGLLPGAEELLQEISAPLYALSNTNPIHMMHFETMTGLRHFRQIFTSCNWGVRKPSEEIFHRLVKELALKPQQILFVDDLEENVEAAHAVGITAKKCYRSIADLKEIIQEYL